MVSSKRGHVNNHDNRILGHPQRVQSTVSTRQFGPVQKIHGKRPIVISSCSLQSEFLIQVILRLSISMTLMVSTARSSHFPCSWISLIDIQWEFYVEKKCQLDATDEFLVQILLLPQHVSGTIMPIIRSSRVLYKWLLPFVFGAWFSSCRYGVELRVVCPVCGLQPETC